MTKQQQVRFQRANFVVTDIERALTLYRDVLGMNVDFVEPSESDSYSYDVFEIDRESTVRWAVLSTEDQVRVMALTEVPGPLPKQPMPRRAAIVLEVSDVDKVVSGASAAGCKVYREEELHTHDGRIGREVGIVDLDDNLIVIYYIPKTH